jgi:hypothetical protein
MRPLPDLYPEWGISSPAINILNTKAITKPEKFAAYTEQIPLDKAPKELALPALRTPG